jgi:putative DNA primase/helicase
MSTPRAETGEDVRARVRATLDALRAERDTPTPSEAAPAPATTPPIEPADVAKPTGRALKRAKPEKPKQGRGVQFDDPEPWPEPVDGAALLDTIAATFERYVALPKHASTALALWVLHVYAFQAWFTSPFLAVTSPAKRCGKTLLLIVLGALVPRRLFASNVTPAVLFRTIEKYAPTLMIDEADTFIRDNDELRGVLNSGHTRTTAVAIRAVGDDHDPRAFSTWCPKAIALIGKLPGTLDDRSIEIRMGRRTSGERVVRLRQDRIGAECSDARQQAARWTADHLCALQDADPHVPAALHDRAADCWRSLLTLADRAGGSWPAKAREAALALSSESAEEDATTRLLRDIRDIFAAAHDADVLASGVIVERLVGLEDRPWREWSHGRPLTTAKLARLLAGYGVHPAGTVRIGDKTAKGYRRSAFVDAWERYVSVEGSLEASHRNNANVSGRETAFLSRHNEKACDALRSVTNPMNTERCDAVTLSEGSDDGLF